MTMFTNSNARRRSVIWVLMMVAVASLSVAGSNSAFAMGTGGGSTTNPWIQSDQADYGPGSTVTLNGGNWAPGENVHVFVDDANGHTWNHSADVTADDSGLIQDVFNLPNTFVSDYSVTATGDVSGTAATTFTDSQPQSVSVGAPTSVSVVPGASAVYGTVSVTMNGNATNCTTTLGLDAPLPAGATAVFGNSPVTTNTSYTSTFRIDTTAATPLGSTNFHVTATPSANCQNGAQTQTSQQLTLIVASKTVGTVTVGSQTGALTSGTAGSATYTVTVNRNGATGTAFSAALSVTTALPSGATASFNPATVNFAAADTSKTSTLTISTTAATPAGSGSFTVKADNTAVAGDSNTGNGTLTVNAPCTAPVVTTQPAAQSITYGANASFSAAATGAPAPTEQWQVNSGSGFTNLTGETGSTLTLTKPGVASSGNLYRAVFTNGCGSVNGNGVALNVAKKNLTISGAVAQGKVYDRTTGATVSFTGASLVGVVSPDVVTLDSSAYSANFATAAAGTAKPVTVSGVALSGAAAGNYSVAQPTGLTASISQRNVTASISASDKTYDGTRSATITSCSLEAGTGAHGVVSPDVVGCSASGGQFGTAQAGSGKAVTADVALTGAAQANYQLTSPSAATTATINQRNVTASISASDKTYDGTRSATITSCSLEAGTGNHGMVSGDAVGCTATNGKFATKDVGSQAVSADVALNGAGNGNYQLTSPSAATTATINQRNVTASITASDKIYDGTRVATITSCTLEGASGNHGVVSGDTVGCDASNGKFASKDAGSQAVTADVALNGGDDGNYQLTSPSAATTATINQRNVTASISASGKTYDGNRDAAITGCTLEAATGNRGVVSGDAVGCDASNGKFASKDAGSQAVTADVTLNGGDDGNYQLTSSSAAITATINQRNVTASISASGKTYDGTRDATITGCTLEAATGIHGVVSGDAVGCDASNAKFASKDAGSQTVAADVALNGGDDGNYQLTSSSASTTATITPRNVTASITASNKPYDGTRDATITSCTLEAAAGIHGVVSGDTVACDASNGKFASKDAGTQAVTADVALSGSDQGDYQLTVGAASTTAAISKRFVTATITASDKPYDSNRAATVTSCVLDGQSGDTGVVTSETVSCDASNGKFATKDAGLQLVTADVALNGADDGNYQLTSASAVTSATIDQRNVTASITAFDKTYDRTRDATITNCTLEVQSGDHGVISPDVVGCVASNGKFATKDAGSQSVAADVALNGGDKANYQLTSASAATSATINQRNVTASISAAGKTYDGNRDATITSCTLEAATGNHGVVSGDTAGCDASNGKFAAKDAGSQAVTADVALNGGDEGNYQLTSPSAATTATINQRNVTASISAAGKTYDGTRDAVISSCTLEAATGNHGVVSGDAVGCSASNGKFATRNAGSQAVSADVALNGAAQANYQLTSPSAATTATINQRNVTASISAMDKTYDSTRDATITSCTLEAAAGNHGVVSGDTVGCDASNGKFATRNAGNQAVSADVALNGSDDGNYQLTSSTSSTTATIKQAPLNISAVTDSRQYNGGVSSSGIPLVTTSDLQGPDTVSGLAQQFQSKNVLGAGGSTLVVSAYTVNDGNSGHNYNVNLHNANGTITAKPLTVTGITAASKPWDGNTSATLNTSGAALNGVVSGDSVGLDTSAAVGAFSSSAVGTWTVQVSGLALTGADKTNYSLTQPASTASIGAWSATGFYDPVGLSSSLFVAAPGAAPTAGANTVWNTVKGGQTVPLKFNLYTSQGGAERRSTSDISGFDAVKLAACTGDSTDAIDFVTTGNTSLRYDTTGMQFIQNWKTPATPATCYRVDVKFLDGSAIYAFFKMTK